MPRRQAVGATGTRIEWDAYDVQAPDGTTIEVKTSGHSQAWARSGPAVIVFTGLPGKAGKQSWYASSRTTGPAHVAELRPVSVCWSNPGPAVTVESAITRGAPPVTRRSAQRPSWARD